MNMGFYTHWQLNMIDGQRLGQACYNAAHLTFGGIVDPIRGTLYDPFNDDKAVPLFLAWLEVEVGK